MDNLRLKKKFTKGNRKAFDTIYYQYANAMYAICLRYTRNIDEAADMLQSAFIKVFEKCSMFDPQYELGPWIKRIVINEAINHYRANKRFELVEEENYFDQPDEPIEIKDESRIKEILMEVIQQLPDGYRAVFNMYVLDNLTHQEIADYLGISVNTSKTQLFKARKMLKELLEKQNITKSSITL